MTRSPLRILVACGCAMIVGYIASAAVGQPTQNKKADPKDEKQTAVTAFMRGKLDAAEQALEGLVTEDFKAIGLAADQMKLMSMKAEWNVVEGPVYAYESRAFRKSVDHLAKMAEQKNIDGAGLAYMQVTMQCLSCHKYVRETNVVQVPGKIPTIAGN